MRSEIGFSVLSQEQVGAEMQRDAKLSWLDIEQAQGSRSPANSIWK
jgi:hypothetical protein